MADFNKALVKTGLFEGGYANNPADKGGETYRGISRKYFPNWYGWFFVDQLKPDNSALADNPALQVAVMSFYKTEFWARLLGDEITSQEVAEELYDTGVNMGVHTAVTFLQRALNALNLVHKKWLNISVDGDFGPKTLTALIACLKNPNLLTPLLILLNCQQGSKYLALVESDESQEIFMRGWLSRVSLDKSTT